MSRSRIVGDDDDDTAAAAMVIEDVAAQMKMTTTGYMDDGPVVDVVVFANSVGRQSRGYV